MTKIVICALFLFFPIEIRAQSSIANKISYITVGANLTLDTIHSLKSEDKKRALIKQGIRDGITITTSELLKRAIHKNRPDNSDSKSFPSEHSALSCVSISYKDNRRIAIEFPIAFGTMSGRVLAMKHDWIDVLSGCAIGSLVGLIR